MQDFYVAGLDCSHIEPDLHAHVLVVMMVLFLKALFIYIVNLLYCMSIVMPLFTHVIFSHALVAYSDPDFSYIHAVFPIKHHPLQV